MKNNEKLKKEISSFRKLWKGGTSLSRLGWNKCREARLPAQDIDGIVKICIEPYITPSMTVLEIGANGGGWTWKFLKADEIFCFDALSAEHNNFWKNIKKKDNVHYYQVKDFNCNELINNSIDYVFSYDVFCHISYSGASAYLKNLYKKLKVGANCFIMIADADKYYHKKGRDKLTRYSGFTSFEEFVKDYDGPPNKGRWYWYGCKLFCDRLKEYGYTLINEDVAVGCDKLNPIIHFRR